MSRADSSPRSQGRALLQSLHDAGRVAEIVDEHHLFARWMTNAADRGVGAHVLESVVDEHAVAPASFEVLDTLTELVDRDGKSFFLLPTDIEAGAARRAAFMTAVFNAGTDYASADDRTGTENDFEQTPYSAEELRRIADRQKANDWTYAGDLAFLHRGGTRVATTPTGMLVGLGGNRLRRVFAQRGGTTWGDVFLFNLGPVTEPAVMLDLVIRSGVAPRSEGRRAGGPGGSGALDLDRLLHHEERHARQWATHGHLRFLTRYCVDHLRGRRHFEEQAGLADGGYRP